MFLIALERLHSRRKTMGSKENFYVDLSTDCSNVTGSCHLENVRFPNDTKTKFLVDCGLHQGKEECSFIHGKTADDLNQKLFFNPEDISFCLVTHNHVDHTGRLPLLTKGGFKGNIYMSEDTRVLLPLALNDSQKCLRDIAKRNNAKVLYSETDVEKALNLSRVCLFEKTEQIGEHIKVTYFSNGHLIGAAIILVQISYPEKEDINLLFLGDYHYKNLFLDVVDLPQWVKNLNLIVITESTYGYMDSNKIHKCFAENILRCLYNNGTVVSPVFSLGRAQEILYELRELQNMKELDVNLPIYLDGKLAINYTSLYTNGKLHIKPSMVDFLPRNLTFVDKTTRDKVLYGTDKKIILTTSGMGNYGPAQLYIPEYIKRKNSMIHFTGYTAPDTLGGKLKSAKEGETVEVGGLVMEKSGMVEYTNEFSAHAKADEIIRFLTEFRNLKLVLVTHGEEQSKDMLASRIVKEVKPKAVGIFDSRYLFRVNAYGVVKTMSTKYL